MPEPVLYLRGIPELRDRALSEGMVADLKALTRIESERLDGIADSLAAVEGFLDPNALNLRLRAALPENALVNSLRRLILNIKGEDVDDLLKRLRALREEDSEAFPLSVGELDALASRLPRLLKPIPALRRYRKAERLAGVTGQPLEDVQLICDLRPVFDEDREAVEGLIPLTWLRIVATGGDGLPNVFEAHLTAMQVSDLAAQAEKAVRKLAVLCRKADQWADNGMPNLPLTRTKDKGSNDD